MRPPLSKRLRSSQLVLTYTLPPARSQIRPVTELPESVCVPRSRHIDRCLLLQLNRFDDAGRFRIRLALRSFAA